MLSLAGILSALPVLATDAAADVADTAAPAVEHGAKGGLMDPNPGLMIWTWITFAVVLLLLWKLAWKPLRSQLQAREDRIAETIEKAKRLQAEAESLLEKHREQMAHAEEQVQEIMAEGRTAAERLREETIAAAEQEAKAVLARSRAEIEAERDRAITEIRREAIDLTLLAAGRVIEQSLDDDAHRRLAEQAVAEVARGGGA
jgi:F-type H+-transporting ATPase subunit b